MVRNDTLPSRNRATRSKAGLGIVAVLLLATFTPVQWLRGRLPSWSSPSRSLQAWAEPPDSITSRAIFWLYQNGNLPAPMTIGNVDRIPLLLESVSEDKPAADQRDEQLPTE